MSSTQSTTKSGNNISHLAFATAIVGWVVWYCWDAWHANAATENLILILPVSILGVVLYIFVVVGSFKPSAEPSIENEPDAKDAAVTHQIKSRGTAIKIAVSMAMLGALVLAGPLIGFDIASFAYILVMMAFLGERRIWVLLLAPSLFSIAVVYCFGTLLSTPLPVLIFRGQN